MSTTSIVTLGTIKLNSLRCMLSLFKNRFFLEVLSLNATLDSSILCNKNILLIGPSSGVLEEAKSIDIDSYDVVIRLNRGIEQALSARGALGSKTDVLFHNFKEDGPRGAGNLSNEILSAHNVKYVIYPCLSTANLNYFQDKRGRIEARGSNIIVKAVDPRYYRSIAKAFAPSLPTIGSVAIQYLLWQPYLSLSIIGFSLFQTGYSTAYNSKATDRNSAKAWTLEGGVHDPAKDFIFTKDQIVKAIDAGKHIIIGSTLKNLLLKDGCK